MSTKLYVKDPNNVQSILDLSKIFTTDGGTINGDLKVTGNITLSSEYIKRSIDNALITVCGGSSYQNGAYIALYGKNKSVDPGTFSITANDGTTTRSLRGYTSGSLKWEAKEVEIVNSKTMAHNGYIRYNSGLQICWGSLALTKATTITYPVPFATDPVVAIGTNNNVNVFADASGSTGFEAFASNYTNSPSIRYISIGFWH